MQTSLARRSLGGAALVLALGVMVATAFVASILLLVGEPVAGGAAGVRRLRVPLVHLVRHAAWRSDAVVASRRPE